MRAALRSCPSGSTRTTDGYGIVRPGCEIAPDGDLDVLLAIDNCPEQAIRIEPEA